MVLCSGCSDGRVQGLEPTGQLLVATGETGVAQTDARSIVATLDVASGALKELPLDAEYIFNARWRPDGRAVLVEATVDGDLAAGPGPSMYLAAMDDMSLVPLEFVGSHDSDPDWGPACDAIVVRRGKLADDEAGSSLWQLSIDGSSSTELVDMQGVLKNPDWSADGSRLTFSRTHNDVSEVWVVSPDGSDPTMIVGEADGHGSQPRLSPDGEQVLFIRSVEHDTGSRLPQLFVQNISGGSARQISDDPEGVGAPVWSPDGEWIAFSDGSFWVTLVRPDGTDLRRSETRGLSLDWGPVTGVCDGSEVA